MQTGKRGEASNLRGKKRQPAQGLTECYTRLYRCGDQQITNMRRTIKMALITCPECGKEISDQASVCPNCGAPVAKKFCQHCGEQIDKDCVICPKCGKQVQESGQSNVVINNSASSSSSASSSASSAYNRYRTKVAKNKWVSLILCIFLGWIGAHKFYEGKVGMGILYLFTFGLFGIGWIVDIISIIFKPNPYYV